MKGSAAALARYMEESRSIPTATSFRTLTVTILDARRRELKEGPRKVSFTHLIAFAIARSAQQMEVMSHHFAEVEGKPHRVADGQVNLGLAVDVEKKDGSRTLMVPVIRGAGSLSFDGFLDAYDVLVEKARTNTLTADDLVGANITLTNPGGIGTIASVPRLMTGQGTIVATGSIAYPVGLGNVGAMIGAEKVMTMTSTYDHRIIQGAESGRFLALIEEHLQGEHGFYEDVFGALGVDLGAPPPLPAPAAAAAAATSRDQLDARGRGRDAAGGPGREHLHRPGAQPRPPGRAARPAGIRTRGRPGPRPRGARPDAGATGADPGENLPDVRAGRDAGGRPPPSARDLLRHDRLRDRAHRLTPPAGVAARAHRVGRLPPRADQRRASHAAQAPRRGRRDGALHAQGLPRPAPVLDRGTGHDRADARRTDPALRGPWRPGGRHRDGPPRPAERAGAQPRPRLRHDLRRVRGRLDARGRDDDPAGRHGRRQVPPRHAGHLRASRRGHDPGQPGVEPEPPRVRLGGRRGRHTGRPDLAQRPPRPPGHQCGGADRDPRRRLLPRPGRGSGDAQPAGSRRLQGRRHDPHHHEQPGRLHDRPRRRPLDALGLGPGQGLRRADHPRQRRRRARLHRAPCAWPSPSARSSATTC